MSPTQDGCLFPSPKKGSNPGTLGRDATILCTTTAHGKGGKEIKILYLEGTVAEQVKALLLRETIHEDKKIPGLTLWQTYKMLHLYNTICFQPGPCCVWEFSPPWSDRILLFPRTLLFPSLKSKKIQLKYFFWILLKWHRNYNCVVCLSLHR